MALHALRPSLYGFPAGLCDHQRSRERVEADERRRTRILGRRIICRQAGFAGFSRVTMVSVVMAGIFRGLLDDKTFANPTRHPVND